MIGCLFNGFGQSFFYNPDAVQEIRITFYSQNWEQLLDQNYVAGNEARVTCNVEINGSFLDSVGVRYRDLGSAGTSISKKPLNIDLNHVHGNQNFDGYYKLKLGNAVHDPSFLREVLSYEVAGKYMPAPKANFARVYINDVYQGLYTNVEVVDENMLMDRFGENTGAFVRCDPDVLDVDGDNSNLSNELGSDSASYYPYYDLKSDHGWEKLYELIEVLNDSPNDIETVLNVDRTLWMHALNYCLVNFDSYVGYARNYYLYQQRNGQFSPVLWNLNRAFASFRETDASLYPNGFTIEEAKELDPLSHFNNTSVYARPLMRKLFENSTYRRMYLAHMRTIMNENFDDQSYMTRATYLRSLINVSVQADNNAIYSYSDFQNNLENTVTDGIDYPGIAELMDARSVYLNSYTGFSGEPIISNVSYAPTAFAPGDELTVTADVLDEEEVYLAYRSGPSEAFKTVPMLDDGSQNDGSAGDGTYGKTLSNVGNAFQYYVYAQNDSAGTFSPERAAYEFYEIRSNIQQGDLVLNELMASNDFSAFDSFGESDDWIEIYNTTAFDISTDGLFLTDDIGNLDKWAMPDIVVPADDYLIIWADEDGDQGITHANFKLSASNGEFLGMYYGDGTVIDSISFGPQQTDIAFGRLPNGTGPWVTMQPTFNLSNDFTSVEEQQLLLEPGLFPNPATDIINIQFTEPTVASVQVYAIDGRLVAQQGFALSNTVSMDVSSFEWGVYIATIVTDGAVHSKRFVVGP